MGAKLILSARNEAELERVKKQLTGKQLWLELDLLICVINLLLFSIDCDYFAADNFTGKHAPHEVKIIPLDLASGEDILKEAVLKAVSSFPNTGVDIMIHNAAFERPVSIAIFKGLFGQGSPLKHHNAVQNPSTCNSTSLHPHSHSVPLENELVNLAINTMLNNLEVTSRMSYIQTKNLAHFVPMVLKAGFPFFNIRSHVST